MESGSLKPLELDPCFKQIISDYENKYPLKEISLHEYFQFGGQVK